MRRKSINLFGPILLAGSIHLGCAANAAVAQQPAPPAPAPALDISDCRAAPARVLSVGTCVRSTLDASDPLFEERARYEDYDLQLRRGEAVQIDLDALPTPSDPVQGPARPYSFDAYLEVRRTADGPPLMVNDDRTDSLNSRLIFTADDDRTYIVRARAFGAGTGDYVLRTTAIQAPSRPTEMIGNRIAGRLELGSQTVSGPSGDTQRQASYYFEGRAHERVRLTSSSANVSLQLLRSSGALLGRDYRRQAGQIELLAILPEAGRYFIQVTTPESHLPAVPFDVRVERGMAPAPERPQRIAVGAAVDGEFTVASAAAEIDDAVVGIDFFYRFYEVRARADRPLSIAVDAVDEVLDTVVEVGSMTPLGFAVAAGDDDSVGWNPRLVVPTPHPPTLLIRVRTYGQEVGRYRLLVTQEGPSSPARR